MIFTVVTAGFFFGADFGIRAKTSPPTAITPTTLSSRISGTPSTDAVVDAHQLSCTHFDAFRFFTPDAVPLNRRPLPNRPPRCW